MNASSLRGSNNVVPRSIWVPKDDSVDEKTKKTLIISGIVTGLVVAAVGGTVAVMSGGDDPKGKPGFETNTPALTQAASQQPGVIRSEEHTSELQSLMRISYAVFCLKNKKKTIIKE